MKTFYVWLTLLTDAYVDALMAKTVRRGYSVQSLSDNNSITLQNKCSVLTALQLEAGEVKTAKKELTASEVLNELKTVMGEIGMKYHSVVVYELNGRFAWNVGNITPPEPPPPKETTRFDKVGEG